LKNAFVRPSLKQDCKYIAEHIRDADRGECGLWEVHPEDSLNIGFAYSVQPLTVVGPSGNPAAMFGVCDVERMEPTIWLLGTDEIVRFPTTFLRQSRLWVDHVCQPIRRYRAVGNWVDLRNEKHVGWLKWLGFERTRSSTHNGLEIGYFRKAI